MDEVNRLKLKIQGLMERFGQKVAEYEAEISDIRVEVTLVVEDYKSRIQRLEDEIKDLQNNLSNAQSPLTDQKD
jgi:F0F1-type ATP synthase membrane subunit b/b'